MEGGVEGGGGGGPNHGTHHPQKRPPPILYIFDIQLWMQLNIALSDGRHELLAMHCHRMGHRPEGERA